MSAEPTDQVKSSDPPYDLLVVGGGVHGAWTALEAARAGAKTMLVEKGDFGGGASANSLKVLHGGLRYLQHMAFPRIRESRLSVRSFRAIGSEWIEDIPFLLETRGRGARSPLGMRAALFLHGLLGRLWEDGGSAVRGRVMSLDSAKKKGAPGVSNSANGVACWSEAVMKNSERIVFETCRRAAAHGAVIQNYTEVVSIEKSKQGGWSVRVRREGEENEDVIHARSVVEAVGARKEDAANSVRAVNLVFGVKPFGENAVGLESLDPTTDPKAVVRSGNRLLFFVPRGRQTMVGTWYDRAAPMKGSVSATDVDRWIAEIETVAPGAGFNRANLEYLHTGFLPADGDAADHAVPAKDEGLVRIDEGRWRVRSVKYTTAPELARSTVKKVGWRPLPRLQPSRVRTSPPTFAWETLLAENCPDSSGDLTQAAAEEFVVHVDDALFRRSNVALDHPLTEEQRQRAAERLGDALGWSEERRASETERLLEFRGVD